MSFKKSTNSRGKLSVVNKSKKDSKAARSADIAQPNKESKKTKFVLEAKPEKVPNRAERRHILSSLPSQIKSAVKNKLEQKSTGPSEDTGGLKMDYEKLNARQVEVYDMVFEQSQNLGRWITMAELTLIGMNRDKIRSTFGNLETLRNLITEHHGDELQESFTANALLDDKKWASTKKAVSKSKFVIITGVHANAEIHQNFYKTLKLLEDKLDGTLILAPIGKKNRGKEWEDFDVELAQSHHWAVEEFQINKNIRFLPIRIADNARTPLTGLNHVGSRMNSIIVAASLQEFRYVAISPGKMPHGLFSTGSLTRPQYIKNRLWAQKNDYLSNDYHEFGCIIIEVKNDETFYPHPLLADDNGGISFMGEYYDGRKGTVSKFKPNPVLNRQSETKITLDELVAKYKGIYLKRGDTHVGETDMEVEECLNDLAKEIGARVWILNDFLSAHSVNRHEMMNKLSKAIHFKKGTLFLETEIKENVERLISYFETGAVDYLIMVDSNHHDWLHMYLQSGQFMHEAYNTELGLELALEMVRGRNPFQAAVEKYLPKKYADRIVWTNEKNTVKIYGNVVAHGHTGANGAKPSGNSSASAYGKSIQGHTHTASKEKGAYHVGTSTHLQVGYNDGPSSWTQSSGLIYPTGQIEIFNIIGGEAQSPYKTRRAA